MRTFHTPEHVRVLNESVAAHLDPHTAVAAWFNDVSYDAVTREQRIQAKNANYIYLYSNSSKLGA